MRLVGVSNVTSDQLATASEVCGDWLAVVQNPLAPDVPDDPARAEAHRRCLAFLGYGVLGGLGGSHTLAERWKAGATVAARHGVSTHQVAIAWARALGAVPLVGARSEQSIVDSVDGADLRLTVDDRFMLGL